VVSSTLVLHLRRVLGQDSDGTARLELAAVNRRGKTVDLRIAACPLRTEEGAASGVILVIDHASAPGPLPAPHTAGQQAAICLKRPATFMRHSERHAMRPSGAQVVASKAVCVRARAGTDTWPVIVPAAKRCAGLTCAGEVS
jgi:hypothetical protein